eukprot:8314169-Prorocentrum_lima.AAC.1
MTSSLVGSEMCIRDRCGNLSNWPCARFVVSPWALRSALLVRLCLALRKGHYRQWPPSSSCAT